MSRNMDDNESVRVLGRLKVDHKECDHRGQAVKIAGYTVYAGGRRYLRKEDLDGFDLMVVLTDGLPEMKWGAELPLMIMPLNDRGGVPDQWKKILKKRIIPRIKKGEKILFFCEGGHGRTGTMIASLIALMESKKKTRDPIKAARERYCHKAVETRGQVFGIFDLRNQDVPDHWKPKDHFD